jgi:hypothetical protein
VAAASCVDTGCGVCGAQVRFCKLGGPIRFVPQAVGKVACLLTPGAVAPHALPVTRGERAFRVPRARRRECMHAAVPLSAFQ